MVKWTLYTPELQSYTSSKTCATQTVLDFVADRVKFDDWDPIIDAFKENTILHVISIEG